MTATSHSAVADRGQRRWLLMAVPAVIVALVVAGPYVTFSYHRVDLRPSSPLHIVFLSLHGVSSGTALLIGPLQFVRRIRAEHPRVHRTIGTIYLLAVLVGGIMALASAIVSESGWSAQVGFVILAAYWFYTAFRALRAVLVAQYADHRIWMIRNYSATFAAVLLRVILIVETTALPLVGVRLDFEAAYDVSVWGSITISIFVAELLIVQRSMHAVLPAALLSSVPGYQHEKRGDEVETTETWAAVQPSAGLTSASVTHSVAPTAPSPGVPARRAVPDQGTPEPSATGERREERAAGGTAGTDPRSRR